MIPSRSQVKAQFSGLLDDPGSATFTDAVFQLAYDAAYHALFNAFLTHQCPRIKLISTWVLPVNTSSLTMAEAGLGAIGDIDGIEERLSGSTEKYTDLTEVDKLTQRDPGDRLLEFTWRLDTMFFVGATTARQLRLTVEASGIGAPTDDNSSIGVDGCMPFMANFAVGMAGKRKGYDEIADACMDFAVGPRYRDGILGGELWRLISPRVREVQHVQIAQRRYSATSALPRRRVPYIQAQQQVGMGGTPSQFSTANGTITGAVDGTNATFYLPYPVTTAIIYRSGVLMTVGTDCTFGANVVTFLAGQIPQLTDIITVEAWL